MMHEWHVYVEWMPHPKWHPQDPCHQWYHVQAPTAAGAIRRTMGLMRQGLVRWCSDNLCTVTIERMP